MAIIIFIQSDSCDLEAMAVERAGKSGGRKRDLRRDGTDGTDETLAPFPSATSSPAKLKTKKATAKGNAIITRWNYRLRKLMECLFFLMRRSCSEPFPMPAVAAFSDTKLQRCPES